MGIRRGVITCLLRASLEATPVFDIRMKVILRLKQWMSPLKSKLLPLYCKAHQAISIVSTRKS